MAKAAVKSPRNEVKLEVVREEGSLMKFIHNAVNGHKTTNLKLHVAAVSALWYLAEHGEYRPIEALYNGISEAYQGALRVYVNRVCNGVKPGMSTADREANKPNNWVSFSQKEGFRVIKDRMKARDAFKTDANINKLLKGKMFFQKDVAATRGEGDFSDVSFITRIEGLLAQAERRAEAGEVRPEILAVIKEAASRLAPLKDKPEGETGNPPPAAKSGTTDEIAGTVH